MNPKSVANNDSILDKKNVVSISTGVKHTGGISTNETCVVVGVIKKVDVSSLDSSDVIPIILSDGSTKTDVIEVGEIVPHGVCPTNSGPCKEHETIDDSICGGMQIYVQLDSYNSTPYNAFGTLGAIVRDNDNTLVGLTNNHVVGTTYDTGIGYQWGPTNTDNDTLSHKQGNPGCLFPGSTAATIGRTVKYGSTTTNVTLGSVKRLVPMIFKHPSGSSHAANYSDAALVNLDTAHAANYYPSPIVIDTISMDRHSNTAPILDFSTLSSLTSANICAKVGRTTGRTVQEHDVALYSSASGQYASITSTDSDINVNYISCGGYSASANEHLATFNNTIAIQYQNADDAWKFSNSGDSGSLCWIWSTTNSRWEVLGLVFAGGGSTSYICRMDYVLKQLNIGEAWSDSSDVGSDTQSIYDYIGSTSTTLLSDASACTGLWDGEIRVDSTLGAGSAIQVQFNSQQPVLYYEKISGTSLGATHKAPNFTYDSASGSTGWSGATGWDRYKEIDVDITSVTPAVTTVDSSQSAVSHVYTINGVSAAELHLERNTVYTFNLTNPALLSGGTHPFQIKDSHFTTTNTWGPYTTSVFSFSAGSTAGGYATGGYMNYVCESHGANMGNFIHFDD
jgi:hypothetical protein